MWRVSLIVVRGFTSVQLLAFATDELSLRVGQTLAGLLNATLVSALFSDRNVQLIHIPYREMRKCELSQRHLESHCQLL